MDVVAPQRHDDFVELMVDIPQECVPERNFEPIKDTNVKVVQIMEETAVDVPVSQCQETEEVNRAFPQERNSERMLERVVVEIVEIADHGLLHGGANCQHTRSRAAYVERIVEQIMDFAELQIQEQTVGGVKIRPQELVLFRPRSRSWTRPFTHSERLLR